MTVIGSPVQVDPASVVPNQAVTISGQGFTKQDSIPSTDGSGFFIGGVKVGVASINDGKVVRIDNSGNFVATVVLPVLPPGTTPGTHELKVIDFAGREGLTTITFVPRTVSFSPEVSKVGTIMTIEGAGYPGSNAKGSFNASVTIEYTLSGGTGPTTTVQASPDASGNFTATLKVPLSAGIPSTNSVKIRYRDAAGSEVSDTVAHKVPSAILTVEPAEGVQGTQSTVTGTGFKAFNTVTTLTIGGAGVLPGTNPTTDSQGAFSVDILIPSLDTGNQTVLATVGNVTANVGFIILAAPVVPTLTTNDAEDVFADDIASGNLIAVFQFDNPTKVWSFFNPDFIAAGANTYNTTSTGDIVWIRLLADITFQGKALTEGWNLISLN